jgi:hypothetical protein
MNVETTFFEHYRRCWDSGATDLHQPTSENRAVLLLEHLCLDSDRLFAAAGLEARDALPFFVHNTPAANGHAFWDGQTFRPWFSADEQWTPFGAKVFAAHEVAHSIHYSLQPQFYFRTHEERCHIGRQLVVEGLATYATKILLQLDLAEALWADYIAGKELAQWMQQCEGRLSALAARFLAAWDDANDHPFSYSGSQDAWDNRAGYYVGTEIVRRVCRSQQLALRGLFDLDRPTFESLAKRELRSLAEHD